MRPGHFRAPGLVHLHIDAPPVPGVAGLLQSVCRALDAAHVPCKISSVDGALVGPHVAAAEARGFYAAHTPGLVELAAGSFNDRFGVFASIEIARGGAQPADPGLVPALLDLLAEAAVDNAALREIAVEVENVVACAEDGVIEESPPERRHLFPCHGNAAQAGYEIHHALAFPRGPATDRIALLRAVYAASLDLGLPVGGWFLFDKDDIVALRSVRFVASDDREAFAAEHGLIARLCDALRDHGARRAHSLLEQVLGVWKIRDIVQADSRANAAAV